MLDFVSPVSMIRYLIVWRITSKMVLIPRCLPIELTKILGKLIETSLPTQQSREWRKALAGDVVRWPIEAVIFAPHLLSKRAYGKDELLIWELKLMGEAADHGLFLELILPAMENAATIKERSLRGARNLWGRFDIQSIYVARGRKWEPLVESGKLNMHYRPSPIQWAEGFKLGETTRCTFHYLNWITPFEFIGTRENDPSVGIGPTLQDLFDALLTRMTIFLPGKSGPQRISEIWNRISSENQKQITWALQQAVSQPIAQQEELQSPQKEWPGHKIGMQVFRDILPPLLPYLEMASILHIGEHVRLGCGTFVLT